MSLEGLLGSVYGTVESSVPSSLLPSISNTKGEVEKEEKEEITEKTGDESSTKEKDHSLSVDHPIIINKEGEGREEKKRLIEIANSFMEPESEEPADPVLTKKLEKFHQLRQQNRTFNGNLLGSKSFA